jgi:hypothetical protein
MWWVGDNDVVSRGGGSDVIGGMWWVEKITWMWWVGCDGSNVVGTVQNDGSGVVGRMWWVGFERLVICGRM